MSEAIVRRGVAPLAAAAGALLLTVPFLGSRSFWLDEALSFSVARLDWSEFTNTVTERENNMTLYHLLLRGWTVLGTSEAYVRGLSLVAALAALVVFHALARRLFGTRVALGASVLLAVNPIFVQYAREARGYALCLALVTAASYLFVRGLERPSWWTWTGYAVLAALAVYAHLFAVLVPPAHAVSLLFVSGRRLPWRHLVVSAALLAAGLLPWLGLATTAQSSGIEWAAQNAPGRVFTRLQELVPAPVGAVVVALAAAASLYLALRLRHAVPWRWAFVLSWALVPVALVVLVSYFGTPVFVIRYFIVVVPPLVLVLALALSRIARPPLYAGAVALAAVVTTAFTLTWSASADEHWEDATRFVTAEARPGDGVLFFAPYARVPFDVYLDEVPDAQRTLRPVYPATPWDEDLLSVIEDVPISRARIAEAASGFDRIWLVVNHAEFESEEDNDAVLAGLEGFTRASEREFAGVTVAEYERDSS